MAKIRRSEDVVSVVDEDGGGEVRVVEISRMEARALFDADLPVDYAALIDALDECQGAADEHDSVIVLVIKAGPID